MLRDSSKTCRSGRVKFDEKLKIDNSIRKHPSTLLSNTDHLHDVLINLVLIRSFIDG